MKLSVSQLRSIIKEEVSRMLAEAPEAPEAPEKTPFETLEVTERDNIIKAINTLLKAKVKADLITGVLKQYYVDLKHRSGGTAEKVANLMPKGYARPVRGMSKLHSMGIQAGADIEDDE